MTKGFSIYFALCIKNRMFYVLNDSIIATFSCLDLRLVWKSHATLTPLAKQDGPLWLQYN